MNKLPKTAKEMLIIVLGISLSFFSSYAFAQSSTAFDSAACTASFLQYCDDGELIEDNSIYSSPGPELGGGVLGWLITGSLSLVFFYRRYRLTGNLRKWETNMSGTVRDLN